jgi:hypothetical protein
MITKNQLRTDLPTVVETNGYTNVVLALRKPSFYTKDNTYIPCWEVSNTVWYNKHADKYVGWIELEDINYDN